MTSGRTSVIEVSVVPSCNTTLPGKRVTLYFNKDASKYPPLTPVVGSSQLTVATFPSNVKFKLLTFSGISIPAQVNIFVLSPSPASLASMTCMLCKPSKNVCSYANSSPAFIVDDAKFTFS